MKRKMKNQAKAISERVRMMVPHDGCILQVPDDVDAVQACQLSEELHRIWPDRNFLLVCGDIRQVDEAQMNKHGWYRRTESEGGQHG